MRIASPRKERGNDRRLLLPQSENGRHRTAARARRERARVPRRARDALRGHAGARCGLACARAPQRAVGRVPRGRMDPRPGRRRASREGRRLLADAAERAARRPRARRTLRRARHLRAAARGVPAGGLGAGRGDPRTLTFFATRAAGRGLTGSRTRRPPRGCALRFGGRRGEWRIPGERSHGPGVALPWLVGAGCVPRPGVALMTHTTPPGRAARTSAPRPGPHVSVLSGDTIRAW